MSNGEIRVGDLVVIVRAHCAGQEEGLVGKIKTVTSIHMGRFSDPCPWCVKLMAESMLMTFLDPSEPPKSNFPLAWVRKIKPLEDDQLEEHPEDVPEELA